MSGPKIVGTESGQRYCYTLRLGFEHGVDLGELAPFERALTVALGGYFRTCGGGGWHDPDSPCDPYKVEYAIQYQVATESPRRDTLQSLALTHLATIGVRWIHLERHMAEAFHFQLMPEREWSGLDAALVGLN